MIRHDNTQSAAAKVWELMRLSRVVYPAQKRDKKLSEPYAYFLFWKVKREFSLTHFVSTLELCKLDTDRTSTVPV